jgi:hypothetical protein
LGSLRPVKNTILAFEKNCGGRSMCKIVNFFIYFFKNICLILNFSKLYYYRHRIRWLSTIAPQPPYHIESCRSRRKLHVSYKVYIHLCSYKKLWFFENAMWYGGWSATVPCRRVIRRLQVGGYCSQPLSHDGWNTIAPSTAIS